MTGAGGGGIADYSYDVALIKLASSNGAHVPMGVYTSVPNVQNWGYSCLAAGNMVGSTGTYANIVAMGNLLQTDNQMCPGSNGGPVFSSSLTNVYGVASYYTANQAGSFMCLLTLTKYDGLCTVLSGWSLTC